ncbi:hypothetical protein [Candidatus Leptofilum sp.]|uniref:hypothetical protein n=1 Tax=Candidatus Leptofilum sp. TaxID=3241576 RepID=UPI003B5A8369
MTGLQKFWRAWKRFGQFMLDWTSRIILTLFYFTIFAPFGLIMRLFGDRLDIKETKASWLERAEADLSLEDARRLT